MKKNIIIAVIIAVIITIVLVLGVFLIKKVTSKEFTSNTYECSNTKENKKGKYIISHTVTIDENDYVTNYKELRIYDYDTKEAMENRLYYLRPQNHESPIDISVDSNNYDIYINGYNGMPIDNEGNPLGVNYKEFLKEYINDKDYECKFIEDK